MQPCPARRAGSRQAGAGDLRGPGCSQSHRAAKKSLQGQEASPSRREPHAPGGEAEEEEGWSVGGNPGGSPGFAAGLGARAACPALPVGPAWVAWGGCHTWGKPGSSPSPRVGGARGDVSRRLRSRALVLGQSLPVPARLPLSSRLPCVHPSPLVFLPCPGAPHQRGWGSPSIPACSAGPGTRAWATLGLRLQRFGCVGRGSVLSRATAASVPVAG